MTLYSQVVGSTPGQPEPLPDRIRLPDGSTRTSLGELTEAERNALGWYVVNEVKPALQAGQRYGAPSMMFSGGVVMATYPVEPIPPVPAPATVTRFQARAALHNAGLLGQVETLMADPGTDRIAKLAWSDALEFKRNSPTVSAMAATLGLTGAQLDDLFRAASVIEA